MTFFLVKEKIPGKNKLVPRLLGITRESVMRVDEVTKEVQSCHDEFPLVLLVLPSPLSFLSSPSLLPLFSRFYFSQVIKTWPLTTVRRWASTPSSFTLDFGDYAESYYSAQTGEGEAISSLIAGYIDIILKVKNGKEGQQTKGIIMA